MEKNLLLSSTIGLAELFVKLYINVTAIAIIENMLSLHHSWFNIYCGPTIYPHDEDALEYLVRYIARSSFSQERMTYIPANQSPESKAWVIYQSKDGKM